MNSYRFLQKQFLAILILLVGAGWIWFSRIPSQGQNAASIAVPQRGFLAPGLTLSTLEGTDLSLLDLRGSPVILNFWASWCPPCRAEMPAFQQVYHEYEAKGLIIAAVNATSQDSIHDAAAFVSNTNLTFPILLDETGSAGKLYNIHSLPTTVFINKQGIIQKIIIGGPIPIALLRIQVDKLMQDEP